jgi:Type I phosphodiesterase / nucleotide pyrophosphatase
MPTLLRCAPLLWIALAGAVAQAKTQPAPPRLVVFIAVDGLPQRQIEQNRALFGPDGFNRFLLRGTSYTQAYYGHAHTVTGAGHATMLTGAYPQRTGIVGNEWLDPVTGASVYCTEDRDHRYLDPSPTPPNAGTSPKNLLAETVGDVLRGRFPGAKVIGISGKDRGAILPAGHKGTAYMYRTESGRFTSSTYYMPAHPAWVNAFNARRPADALAGAVWRPLLGPEAYIGSVPDGQPWMASAGFGKALPATLTAGPRLYGDILTSPFGDQITLAFARAAIAGEQLGADRVPDVLAVSLSSHDYIGHAFGPESRLSQDHLLHLDRQLEAFFQHLDATVGAGAYVVALTADHGFADTPEARVQRGETGGRLPVSPAVSALSAAMAQQFGAARLVRGLSAGGVLFDDAAIDAAGLQRGTVYAAAAAFLRELEGVHSAHPLADLTGDASPNADQPHLAAMRLSYHPQRSAQVALAPLEGWIFSSRQVGATHGSPWAYDRHVPILLWGPRWFGQAGPVAAPVEVVDIAPTLARVLQIPVPAQSQGRVLPRRAAVRSSAL